LFYTRIETPVPSREADPANGLTFRFLEDGGLRPRVLTGHDEGVITLNIAEADDAAREKTRTSMQEPYRTLSKLRRRCSALAVGLWWTAA
jgi:hypothetical protein